MMPSDRRRENRHKLEYRKPHINMGINFFIVSVLDPRAGCPGYGASFSGEVPNPPEHCNLGQTDLGETALAEGLDWSTSPLKKG